MIERLVSSSDMLHFAFGQSSSFVKQWSWVKQSKLGKTLPVSSKFIKCAQVFRAKKLHWNDGKACQSWGSGCPFPLPAQQQNHALWWNDVLRNLPWMTMVRITWSFVFAPLASSVLRPEVFLVEGWPWSACSCSSTQKSQTSARHFVLCACSSVKFGNCWDRFSVTLCHLLGNSFVGNLRQLRHNTTCSENKVFSQRSLHVGTPRRSRCLFPVECEWSHATKWHSPVALNAPFAVC